jgi:hypothetical protein
MIFTNQVMTIERFAAFKITLANIALYFRYYCSNDRLNNDLAFIADLIFDHVLKVGRCAFVCFMRDKFEINSLALAARIPFLVIVGMFFGFVDQKVGYFGFEETTNWTKVSFNVEMGANVLAEGFGVVCGRDV